MTNSEIVLTSFDAIGDAVVASAALVHAIARRHTVNEALATQLINQAIKDGVIAVDPLGMVRRV